ncbi:MAG: cytochrome c oxidase subunit 3 family protein [Cocleimonas sp.]|nr:cytochrome c oxidase subunit 3 family protein [Cocleimonas sp.]
MSASISTNEPKLLPGDLAIWFFIFMELLVFAVAFISYSVMRLKNIEEFNQYQQTLNTELGAANTILLITSSYFVIRAIHAIKVDDIKGCANWLYAALAGGTGFLILKTIEYQDKFSQGIDLSTNTFYFFYLSLTMFHFLHVILGMIILLFIAIKTQRGGYSSKDHVGIESGASYWHMVDLVWIVLFPLVYIIR